MKSAFVTALLAASAMSNETYRSGRSKKAVPGHSGSKVKAKAIRDRRKRRRRQHACCRVSHGMGSWSKHVWTEPNTGAKMLRPTPLLGSQKVHTPDEATHLADLDPRITGRFARKSK